MSERNKTENVNRDFRQRRNRRTVRENFVKRIKSGGEEGEAVTAGFLWWTVGEGGAGGVRGHPSTKEGGRSAQRRRRGEVDEGAKPATSGN